MIPVYFRAAGFCIAKLAELCLFFSLEHNGRLGCGLYFYAERCK